MHRTTIASCLLLMASLGGASAQSAAGADKRLDGAAAYGDWRTDALGVARKITPSDLPAPMASPSVANPSQSPPRPPGAVPKVPPGFAVDAFATGLAGPRVVRVAPNGDVFVSETRAGTIKVLRAATGSPQSSVFAGGLDGPFGIAFYPAGPDPRYVYVATHTAVLRFPYRSGDLQASAKPETVVAGLPGGGGHSTRDVVFSTDGRTMFVSVGSGSNVAGGMARLPQAELAAFETSHALGAAWGPEQDRADVLAFAPDGGGKRTFATGIRNCVGMAIQPDTGALWCAVNERDGLGDNLPPDYATSVTQGGFYGWPWFYIGDHQDPRLKGERPDLATKVSVPDVLIQPHSAPLGITFYAASQFPDSYRGDAFVTLHGSWNRAQRTGYKVVRLLFKDGKPTGDYADFMDGFVAGDAGAWGRPVDTAVMRDGSLLVSDDVSGTLWRVTYKTD